MEKNFRIKKTTNPKTIKSKQGNKVEKELIEPSTATNSIDLNNISKNNQKDQQQLKCL